MDESRRCTARSKRSGERCKRAAIRGGFVCSIHGGRSKVVMAKAEARLARVEAEQVIRDTAQARGPLSLSDVYAELMKTAAISVEWRNALERAWHSLQDWRYTAKGTGAEQVRGEIVLFERALDRTAKVLDMIARLNLDARAAALSERQGEAVADALRRVLTSPEVRLSLEQRVAAEAVIPRELRRLYEVGL